MNVKEMELHKEHMKLSDEAWKRESHDDAYVGRFVHPQQAEARGVEPRRAGCKHASHELAARGSRPSSPGAGSPTGTRSLATRTRTASSLALWRMVDVWRRNGGYGKAADEQDFCLRKIADVRLAVMSPLGTRGRTPHERGERRGDRERATQKRTRELKDKLCIV